MKAIILYFALCIIITIIIALIVGWNPMTGIPHIGFFQ